MREWSIRLKVVCKTRRAVSWTYLFWEVAAIKISIILLRMILRDYFYAGESSTFWVVLMQMIVLFNIASTLVTRVLCCTICNVCIRILIIMANIYESLDSNSSLRRRLLLYLIEKVLHTNSSRLASAYWKGISYRRWGSSHIRWAA